MRSHITISALIDWHSSFTSVTTRWLMLHSLVTLSRCIYVSWVHKHVSLCFKPIYQTTFKSKQGNIEFCICNKKIDDIKRANWLPTFLTLANVASSFFKLENSEAWHGPTSQGSVAPSCPFASSKRINAVTLKSRISESEDQRTNSNLKVRFAMRFTPVSQFLKKRVIWRSSTSVYNYGQCSALERNGQHENL